MKYLSAQYSWAGFFTITLLLVGAYLVLRFFSQILKKANVLGRYQSTIESILSYIYLFSTPAIILYLSAVFILVKPLLHGLIIGLVLSMGYAHLRTYFSGRILRLNDSISIGQKISCSDLQGIIYDIGWFGLQLKTGDGLSFVNYSRLYREGYLLLGGEDIGGLYKLRLSSKEQEVAEDDIAKLRHLFTNSPYIDWSHRPELARSGSSMSEIDATILVKEEGHLHDLLEVIGEWGYESLVIS